jgi:hypothetical protein
VTDAAHETGDETLARSATAVGDPLATRAQAAMTAIRQPIVLVLLMIAFFTTISGKPLDGFLMLTVATLLAWDAGRYAMSPAVRAVQAARAAETERRLAVRRGHGQRRLLTAGLASLGALYAGVVSAFSRYSWPATISVVALGCLMVAIGWQGPVRRRAALTGDPLRRAWLWAAVMVAGGMWELSSLLQQPHLTTDSYAHPTISALTDPLLASHPGRSVALGAWLLIGWFAVGR